MDNKISVVIHTYNNEKIIGECLEAVKDFDEIVLCDMYSSDKTLEIARQYANCKIVMHEMVDLVERARNYAISQASNQWVLVVDSDEIITKELREYLYEFIKNPDGNAAISFPRANYAWGVVSGYDRAIRFYKRDCVSYPPCVHAVPEIKGQIYKLDEKNVNLAIIHKQERTVSGWLKTIDAYTDFELEKWIKEDKKFNFWFHSYKSFFIIFEKFILKGGFKLGIRGFILSVLVYGLYKFVIGCKYWEYKLSNKQ